MKIFSNRKWLVVFLAGYGLFVFLPFLAPAMMYWGFPAVGKAVYAGYSLFCHQLPERSLFFFGEKSMYSLAEIQSVWQNTNNPFVLRQFIGNPDMGWKVAWSDRMIAMYGGVWLFGLIWAFVAKSSRKISIWMFVFLTLPMALDGVTHFLSDLSGLSTGFRYTNDWLAALTGNRFSVDFYTKDALGSFNSLARWITGLIFAFGIVWWAFPYLDESFTENNPSLQKGYTA